MKVLSQNVSRHAFDHDRSGSEQVLTGPIRTFVPGPEQMRNILSISAPSFEALSPYWQGLSF
jgi:hypothetical protein